MNLVIPILFVRISSNPKFVSQAGTFALELTPKCEQMASIYSYP